MDKRVIDMERSILVDLMEEMGWNEVQLSRYLLESFRKNGNWLWRFAVKMMEVS